MQYDKMKVSVGIFIVVLIMSLGGFLYLFLDAKGVFKKRYRYYFITESAASFSIGMPVKFSGFAIGSIDDIKLLDDGEVKITFSVTQENRKWINKYTYLLLKKPLIGSAHIEVLAASGNGYLPPYTKLPIIITDDVNDLVEKLEPVVDRLLTIIKNVETLTNTIVAKDSSFNKTMKNLEHFSAKLAYSDSLLTSLTGDKKATKSFIRSLYQIEQTLQHIEKITKDLNKDLIKPTSKTIGSFHDILDDLYQKLQHLDPLVKNLGKSGEDLIPLEKSIQALIIKTELLMEKVDTLLSDTQSKQVELP